MRERDYRLINDIDPEIDTRTYMDAPAARANRRERIEEKEAFEGFAEEWQGYMQEWEDNF